MTKELTNEQIKILKKLDKFFARLYSHKGMSGSGAYDVGDIIGVLIGVKPATVNYLFAFMMSGYKRAKLAKMIRKLGLEVEFENFTDMRSSGEVEKFNKYVRYYVSDSKKTLFTLRSMFKALTEQEQSKDLNEKIGLMLGYPETAIDYYLYHRNESAEDEARDARGYVLASYYVHSLENVDAEFEAYEKPIFEVMSKYCPKVWEKFCETKVVLPSGDVLPVRTK
jgi:hypothetical protein